MLPTVCSLPAGIGNLRHEFGICRIGAGHRMTRHSPVCPGLPSLTVGKDLGQRLAS